MSANGFSLPHAVTEIRKRYGGPLSIAQDLDFWDVGREGIYAGHVTTAERTWGLTFGGAGDTMVAGPRAGGDGGRSAAEEE
jgi:hypothetical protein